MTFFFGSRTAAQTLLLSSELCHVALPKGRGFGATSFGLVSGLRKCVMIWNGCPKTVWNRVASGRAPLTVQDAVNAPAAGPARLSKRTARNASSERVEKRLSDDKIFGGISV